jgi:hypothetical protein
VRRHKARGKKLTKEQIARRVRLKTIGKWTLLGLGTYELYLAMVSRRTRRRDTFNLALQKQVEKSKPLIVLGDPDGYFMARVLSRDFDCGELCIDPHGCGTCNTEVGYPEDVLASHAANSAVIFANIGVIERAKDANKLLSEIQRVSGGDFYAATLEPWSILAWLPPTRRRVLSAPPKTAYTEWRNLPWLPGPAKKERLSGFGSLRLNMGPFQ